MKSHSFKIHIAKIMQNNPLGKYNIKLMINFIIYQNDKKKNHLKTTNFMSLTN